jgi:mannan endo-1,4-beta-mannosidase
VRRAAGLLALVLALLTAASCTSAKSGSGGTDPGSTPAVTASLAAGGTAGLPDPRKRMLLGAYVSLSGQQSAEASVEARERAMGRPYDLGLTYYNWTDPFPDAGEAAMVANGTTPLMAWYGPDKNPGPDSTAALTQIASGADDARITAQAEAIKAFGHRIFLRLMPEMNADWYGYSFDPAAFIAAWRHIYDVFARAGATNVTWVWCPNLSPDNWDSYYPGNAYVDVIGVDGYSTTATRQTFQQLFGGFFAHFASFARGKPQLVAETATNSGAGSAAGIGSAASFITGMGTYLHDVAGPRYDVIGVCWFDTDTNNGYNWRVDQTPAAWRAWLALAREPYFGGTGRLTADTRRAGRRTRPTVHPHHRTRLAGTPTYTAPGSQSLITSAPAPMTVPAPMVTPGMTITRAPSQQPSPICTSRGVGSRGTVRSDPIS